MVKLWRGSTMLANGCSTRCVNGCGAAANVTSSPGSRSEPRDIGVTRTDAIYLSNKPFWKE